MNDRNWIINFGSAQHEIVLDDSFFSGPPTGFSVDNAEHKLTHSGQPNVIESSFEVDGHRARLARTTQQNPGSILDILRSGIRGRLVYELVVDDRSQGAWVLTARAGSGGRSFPESTWSYEPIPTDPWRTPSVGRRCRLRAPSLSKALDDSASVSAMQSLKGGLADRARWPAKVGPAGAPSQRPGGGFVPPNDSDSVFGYLAIIGTVVGLALAFAGVALSNNLPGRTTVDGVVWSAALVFDAFFIGAESGQWWNEVAFRLTGGDRGRTPMSLAANLGSLPLSFAVSTATVLVLVLWHPEWVLPAVGLGAVLYLAASITARLRRPTGTVAVAAASPATNAELILAVALGLGVGALMGCFSKAGWPTSSFGGRLVVVIIGGAIGVYSGVVFAPVALEAIVRRRRPDAVSGGVLAFAAGILAGMAIAWTALTVLGIGSA